MQIHCLYINFDIVYFLPLKNELKEPFLCTFFLPCEILSSSSVFLLLATFVLFLAPATVFLTAKPYDFYTLLFLFIFTTRWTFTRTTAN